MSDFMVYIPSFKRAKTIISHRLFDDCRVVIPESQYSDYLETVPQKWLFPIPDSQDGSFSKKINAILNLAPHDFIVICDDDVHNIIALKSRFNLSSLQISRLVCSAFQMCQDVGTGYWGVNWQTQPLYVDWGTPLSFTKFFASAFSGVVRCEMRFDENLIRTQDVDYWFQSIRKWKKTIRFNWFRAHADYKKPGQTGGIETKRDGDQSVNLLRKRWGEDLLPIDENGDIKCVLSPYNVV